MFLSALMVLSIGGTTAWAQIPPELDRASDYSRREWLEDSLRTTDLIVIGTPRRPEGGAQRPRPTSRFDIERILFGAVDRDLHLGGTLIRITKPYRFHWEERGLYILVRTTQGYFSMNPTFAPIAAGEWKDLEAALVPASPDPERTLYEHKTQNQIYHAYAPGEFDGTSVSLSAGEVFISLYEMGTRVLYRAWDREGRLWRTSRIDGSGNGFYLSYSGSHLSEYAHIRHGKREGVERKFFQNGRLREEIYWHDGLRHGRSRTWDQDSKLSEIVYEDGFIAPVIRFRGAPGAFTIYKSEFGVSYAGPSRLIDSFQVGMPVEKVSNILRLDFSERTGLHFGFYRIDTFLNVSFENGRVSAIKTGWNGVDYEIR